MLNKLWVSFLLFLCFFTPNVYADLSPIGKWQTIDDKTHKPSSVIEIWQEQDELKGRIVNIFYNPGENTQAICSKCKGDKHNQPILGMIIIWDMERHGNEWSGGKILDPENGKIYNASLRVSDDGNELKVRGYVAMPLFGRTQTWKRIPWN